MYCAICGSLINEQLNYCNRCGNRVVKGNELTARQADSTAAILRILSCSTGVVGVVGLGGLIGLIAILAGNAGNRSPAELIVVVSILFLLTTFGICFLLIRQISRLTDKMLSSQETANQKSAPDQLNFPAAGGQIESLREPFLSVTENTTRTLDEVLAKRN